MRFIRSLSIYFVRQVSYFVIMQYGFIYFPPRTRKFNFLVGSIGRRTGSIRTTYLNIHQKFSDDEIFSGNYQEMLSAAFLRSFHEKCSILLPNLLRSINMCSHGQMGTSFAICLRNRYNRLE